MGLFSSNFDRPGPGVSKDEPHDNRFIHYWKIYGRHFWDLSKLNLLFAIPASLLFIACIVIAVKTNNAILAGLPLIALSPFLAGLTYETRNFIREEHVFILHDFVAKLKENWKQFLVNGLICYVVYEILGISISFYLRNQAKIGTAFLVFASAVSLMILFIFTAMQFYIPLQIVTFDMKLRQMYKNAGIFSIAALGWNLIGFLISGFLVLFLYFLVWAGQYMPLLLMVAILLSVFLIWSFWSYTINSLAYPTIDRLMIQPVLKKEAAERGEYIKSEKDFVDDDDDDDEEDDDEE